MKHWKMATRNIFRSRRRSLVTSGAMAFALGIMIVFSALYDGMLTDFRRNATLMDMGHLQIHQKGYVEKPSLYTKIADATPILKKLDEMGFHATPRLFASGLAAKEKSSAGARIWGMDAEREKATVKLAEHVMHGEWLSPSDEKGVVLGRMLAKSLKADIGDEIVLVSQAADGSMANDLYRVRGIMKSVNEEIDRAGLLMTIPAFRKFMVMDKGVHEIVVAMGEVMKLEESGEKLKAAFPKLDVKTWKALNPAIAELIEVSNAYLIPMITLIYIAVAIVILNAMLMAVFERIKEYGVMKAIGVSPWQVFKLVMAETAVMTVAASFLGLFIGVPLAYLSQFHGIDLSSAGNQASFSGVALDPVWRGNLSFRIVFWPFVMLYVLSLLASIYPAIKAARLNPIEAIHHQ